MKNVFDNTTTYDSVAQLGERHLDRVEVAGSSPVGIIAIVVSRVRSTFTTLKNVVVVAQLATIRVNHFTEM